mmetsp:Transcript_12031/g.18579  ORF Transcript_12031/g.18579 Transcript_12031/m.18579 type:complete len:146 (-) Transcript_12031:165-602(-)|eukprot:CAMPEP_0170512542 /NCGR_PEP_ID=MMETSP0208-20121228/66906_1 /TAXON_ID=197538 /ORGANISM="Strombidium inclinatum, Strain S3" /LENGTH=145 /DNA_ID=CAMNT_0010796183 /DNA_START=262 /DNA_END=699 /DNA_ORIENTATION=+
MGVSSEPSAASQPKRPSCPPPVLQELVQNEAEEPRKEKSTNGSGKEGAHSSEFNELQAISEATLRKRNLHLLRKWMVLWTFILLAHDYLGIGSSFIQILHTVVHIILCIMMTVQKDHDVIVKGVLLLNVRFFVMLLNYSDEINES